VKAGLAIGGLCAYMIAFSLDATCSAGDLEILVSTKRTAGTRGQLPLSLQIHDTHTSL
jgi:hypothetical protein